MKLDSRFVTAFGAAAVAVVAVASGAPPVVNFESLPDDGPAWEGAIVGDQFWTDAGVRFSNMEPGHQLVLAKVGAPMRAFSGFGGGADLPYPGAAVGSFFVTDDHGGTGSKAGPFLIEYAYPVNKVSATILDVDCTESWRADAYDDQGERRGTAQIYPTTADGSAYSFAIEVADAVITRVVITYTGTCSTVTFAMDNVTGSRSPCPADLTEDGQVDFGDYLAFLTDFDQGDLRVDFNGDGIVDFSDYLEFLTQYAVGC